MKKTLAIVFLSFMALTVMAQGDNPVRRQLPNIENQLNDIRLKELHRRAAKIYASTNDRNVWEGGYASKWANKGGQLMLLNYIYAADEACFEESNEDSKRLYHQTEWEQVCTAMLNNYFNSSQRTLPTTQPARYNAVEKEIEALAVFVGSVLDYEYEYQYVEASEVERKLNRYLTLWLTRETYAKAPQSALAALQDERQAWEDLRDSVLSTCADNLTCTRWGGNTPAGSFYHDEVSQSQKEVDDFRKASIKRFSAIIGAGNFNEHAADQPTISNPQELLNTFKVYFADSDFEGDDWTINEVTENTKATIAAYEKFEACRKRVEETLPENMRAAYAKETRAYLNLIDFE